jgi:hypothetical protein
VSKDGPKLYNLASDIGETKDLFAAMPDKAKELQTKWDDWNATLLKPLWSVRSSDSFHARARHLASLHP